MLFPLVKKVEWTNPFKAGYQLICIGVMGVCLYFYGDLTEIGNKPVVVSTSQLDSEIDKVLSGKTLKEKEKVYKLFSGIVDYSQNSDRIHKNREIEEMVTEVVLTYKLEEFTELEPIIQSKVKEVGLEKDSKLSDSRDKIKKAFGELADSVKKNIEKEVNKTK
jgi:hypothetical protein